MKLLSAKFLPDFQNVDTKIFGKASNLKKIYAKKYQVRVKGSKNN